MPMIRDYLFLPLIEGVPRRQHADSAPACPGCGVNVGTPERGGDSLTDHEVATLTRAVRLLETIDPRALDVAAFERAFGGAFPARARNWIDAYQGASDRTLWARQLHLLLRDTVQRAAPVPLLSRTG